MLKLSVLLIAFFCMIGVAFTYINLNDEELIHTINTHPTAAWKATAYKKFQGKTVGDVGHMFGAYLTNQVRPSMYAAESESHYNFFSKSLKKSIPTNFDSRQQWSKCIHPIRNQQQCGSCWAFSSSEMLSDRFCIASNGTVNTVLSPQFMVSCDKYDMGCNGGNLDSLWKFLSTTGTVEDRCWPYVSGSGDVPSCRSTCTDGSALKLYKADSHSIKNFHAKDMEAVQEDIMTHGPIMSGFMVYQDFMQYSSGVYHHVSGSLLGGHAIKIVGWGVDSHSNLPYWIVANSWGPEWGLNGFFWIKRNSDECQIEQNMYTARAQL